MRNFRITLYIEGVRDPIVTEEPFDLADDEDVLEELIGRVEDREHLWKLFGDTVFNFKEIIGFRVEEIG